MPGIGQETVISVRPDLATQVTPINFGVEQNAVAQLSDAFRQGVITSDDIIQRYGDLAKTKQKAEIQGLHEFISPQAIEARQNATQLANETTKAGIRSLPAQEQAKSAELESLRIQAEKSPEDFESQQKYAQGLGFSTPVIDPKVGLTEDYKTQMRDTFQKAVNYDHNQKMALAFVSRFEAYNPPVEKINAQGVKTLVQPGPEKTIMRDKATGAVIDGKTYWQAYNMATQPPSVWEHSGKPQFMELFGGKPGKFGGGIDESPGPLSTPEVTAKQPAATAAPITIPLTMTGETVLKEEQPQTLELVSKIRDTMTKEDDYKAYKQSKPFYGGFVNVYNELKNSGSNPNAGIDDIALISDFVKLYDPSAVIREFKFDKIESTRPLPSKIKTWMDNVLNSKSNVLDQKTRDEIYRTGNAIFAAKEQGAFPGIEFAAKRADELGIKPDQVLDRAELNLLQRKPAPIGGNEPTAPVVSPTAGTPAFVPKVFDMPGLGKGYYNPVTKRFYPNQ